MSPPTTLLSTCIDKTGKLLLSGVWEGCDESLFSRMPLSVVQGLLSSLWPPGLSLTHEGIEHSRLLLTSGRLEHVALPHGGNGKHYTAMLQWLSRGCRNLRTLSVLWGDQSKDGRQYLCHGRIKDAKLAHEQILQRSSKLEYLHSCIYFEPDSLENCRNLKILRLHFGSGHTKMFFRRVTPGLWERFRSLAVLAVCMHRSSVSDDEELRLARAILEQCPQLTSVGLLDTSAILGELHETQQGAPLPMQLRRCYWNDSRMDVSRSVYCDSIRAAVSSCPGMEALVMKVCHAGGLQPLGGLRDLTYLHLDFGRCVGDFRQEFYSLLEGVGSQLRHLSVYAFRAIHREPVTVNVICGSCPNLSTLELDCAVTTDEGAEPFDHLMNLERLNVANPDRRTLFYLLGNCLHLRVLCLEDCKYLDDSAMPEILRQNPFAELEVALVGRSFLSRTGLKRFLQCAVKLRAYLFGTRTATDRGMAWQVFRHNPGAARYYDNSFKDLQKEQFPSDFCSCCWL